jgi:5'-nucleotidase
MPFNLKDKLVIGVSSSSLFSLEEDDRIFREQGLKAYCDRQIELENEFLRPGTAFPLIREILKLNELLKEKRKALQKRQLVEVILMSKNSPDTSLRIFNSLTHHKLDISRAVLTGGRPLSKYLKAFNVGLFLSTDEADVREAYESDVPSALVYNCPLELTVEDQKQELRIAFDGDAVLFSEESEQIYQSQGLEAFIKHETEQVHQALAEGPFAPLLKAIALLQKELGDYKVIRTALVTARNSPAHKRVILTLREWGVRIDEAFFLGGVDKSPVIESFRPHFFFDDQHTHLETTARHTPVGRVPAIHTKEKSKKLKKKK